MATAHAAGPSNAVPGVFLCLCTVPVLKEVTLVVIGSLACQTSKLAVYLVTFFYTFRPHGPGTAGSSRR